MSPPVSMTCEALRVQHRRESWLTSKSIRIGISAPKISTPTSLCCSCNIPSRLRGLCSQLACQTSTRCSSIPKGRSSAGAGQRTLLAKTSKITRVCRSRLRSKQSPMRSASSSTSSLPRFHRRGPSVPVGRAATLALATATPAAASTTRLARRGTSRESSQPRSSTKAAVTSVNTLFTPTFSASSIGSKKQCVIRSMSRGLTSPSTVTS
jgi:hypothetical protein